MAVNNLSELFEHELKDIYYAEHRLLEALEQLASETKSRDAKKAYTTHRRETQGQIKRLQKVFKMIGEVPEPEKCPGIEGLLKEKQNFTKKEKPSQEILDYFNMTAAIKTERYEICAYEGLIEIASQLGMEQAVELLAQNLDEEQATLEKLQTFSREYDTTSLMPEQEEQEETAGAGRSGAAKGASRGAAKGGTKGSSKGSSKAAKPARSSKAARGGAGKSSATKGASGRTAAARSRSARATGGNNGAGSEMPDDAMYPQTLNDTV